MIMYTCGEEYNESGKAIEIDNTDGLKRITSLVVDFPLIQEGEGTPSLDNIRPFVVWNHITVDDSNVLYDADVHLVAGSLDVFENQLTRTWIMIDNYPGEPSISSEWLSDRDVYVEGTQPSIGAQVVYPSTAIHEITPNVYNRLLSEGVVTVTANITGGYEREYRYSGDIVSFETESVETLDHLIVSIEPVQDCTPWSGGSDNVPYTFRAIPQFGHTYNSETDTVVGGTVAWNQLVNTGDTSVTVQSGHKYYANINNAKTIGASTGTAITINDSSKDNVFDLTAMFGSTIADYIYSLEQANAGAGVAWFKKLFPKDYYEYNAGELISFSGLESHDTVGFNQLDEEWELGTISTANGEPSGSSTRIRSKNFSDCIGGQTYCNSGSTEVCVYFYDADKAYIRYQWMGSGVTYTFPSNARYFKIVPLPTYGTTYKGDICINLSWSGYRNGEYEPYEKHSYALDNSLTLRGIPKLDASNNLYYDGDEYASDGTVTRKYGIVDLGTLTWQLDTTGTNKSFWANVPLMKKGAPNGVVVKYTYLGSVGWSSFVNNTSDKILALSYSTNNPYVMVKDSAYTDATSFKTAMSGVMLVYELATPTTESADPYQNPQVVDDFGTEEYVTDSIVPVGHQTSYALVCPISGWDAVRSFVSPTTAEEDATVYTTALPSTIYGGTLDVVTGELVVDRAMIASYAGEAISEPWLSSMDEYSAGATPTTGAQVVYPITPQTYQLTPTEVKTLLGANNVWADAGEITLLSYGKDISVDEDADMVMDYYSMIAHEGKVCGGKIVPVLSDKCPTTLEPYMKNLPKMTRC